MSNSHLEVQGLKKSFGLKPVLRGVDLTLCQGERMALLGSNGAGKTTLLRILAGLTKPSAGSVCLDRLDIVWDAQQVRRRVGFVAHQPYLYDELTVMENLLFFGHMYSVQQARKRALELLHRVGMERRIQERVGTLSRGQVQRVAVARALLHSPKLLLLDEPDTGLDQEGIALVQVLLEEHIKQGGAILFTTHNYDRVQERSDSIVTLEKGRIVQQAETLVSGPSPGHPQGDAPTIYECSIIVEDERDGAAS